MKAMVVLFLIWGLSSLTQAQALSCSKLLGSSALSINALKEMSGVTVHLSTEKFYVNDENSNFAFRADLDDEGVLSFGVQLKNDDGTRSALKGHQLYRLMMEHFEDSRINAVKSSWWPVSDNYKQFHERLEEGDTREQAAKVTWSGLQANEFGFSEVMDLGTGEYNNERFLFVKKDSVFLGVERATKNTFKWSDPLHPEYYLEGDLEEGVLSFNVKMRAVIGDARSEHSGQLVFALMMKHFDPMRVVAIHGRWSEGDNQKAFWSAVSAGKSYRRAAKETWTGQQAQAHGFTALTIENEGVLFDGGRVDVLFKRPFFSWKRYYIPARRVYTLEVWDD